MRSGTFALEDEIRNELNANALCDQMLRLRCGKHLQGSLSVDLGDWIPQLLAESFVFHI